MPFKLCTFFRAWLVMNLLGLLIAQHAQNFSPTGMISSSLSLSIYLKKGTPPSVWIFIEAKPNESSFLKTFLAKVCL